MDWSLILQIVGTSLGLLYLWLEYKANIWVWVIGAIMPMVHGLLYFHSVYMPMRRCSCTMWQQVSMACVYGSEVAKTRARQR